MIAFGRWRGAIGRPRWDCRAILSPRTFRCPSRGSFSATSAWSCCAREILEELSIAVSVERLLDCWVYDILGRVKVLIVTYGCSLHSSAPIAISGEHKEVGLFRLPELAALPMPEGYKASVRRWWKQRYTG
jgi:hypothetical protein